MSGREAVIKRFAIYFVVLLLVCSCGTAPQLRKAEPKVALVLGGGSAKGFAHVGVLRALEKEKIPIHMIGGTSVGSLIGGLYAANPDSFQLEWAAFKINRGDILDFSVASSKMGPVQGAKLESFVEYNAKVKTVETTKIPFYPVATDLNTGETVTLEKGSLAKAIHASSAIPGIFVPVRFGNRTLVDGGVTNNIACEIARSKGANVIIAVNLQKDVRDTDINSVIDVIAQSISIMMHVNSKMKLAYADVILEPDTKGISMFDFTQKKVLMEEGVRSAEKVMPQIKALVGK
ncbi:MAG: patatin-like phospholipase family protein [Syntrophorhabdaceae bacterium]